MKATLAILASGMMPPMLVGIDRAGRVVVPKEVRDRLSLAPDAQLELDIEGDSIRLTPVRQPSRSIVEVDGWPVIAPAAGHTVTDADVQRWRDADQR